MLMRKLTRLSLPSYCLCQEMLHETKKNHPGAATNWLQHLEQHNWYSSDHDLPSCFFSQTGVNGGSGLTETLAETCSIWTSSGILKERVKLQGPKAPGAPKGPKSSSMCLIFSYFFFFKVLLVLKLYLTLTFWVYTSLLSQRLLLAFNLILF